MNITRIINTRLNKLEVQVSKLSKEYKEDLEVTNNIIDELTLVLDELSNDIYSLKDMDLSSVLGFLKKYSNIDVSYYKKQINTISKIMVGIKDKNLHMSITQEQQMFINDLIRSIDVVLDKLNKEVEELNGKIRENDKKVSELHDEEYAYLELMENITSNELILIYDKDWYLIDNILEDSSISIDKKRAFLVDIKKYNDSVIAGEKEFSKTDIKEFENVFDSYGLITKYEETVDDNLKDYIERKGNVGNFIEILEYFKRENILNEFTFENLLIILLFGSLTSVTTRYDEIRNDDNLSVFFETPSAWVPTPSRRKRGVNRNREYVSSSRGETSGARVLRLAHSVSYEEMVENMNFLKQHNLKHNKNAIKMNSEILKKNFDNAHMYGLFEVVDNDKFSTSALTICDLPSKLDKFIELDLGDYIRENPTSVLSREHVAPILFRLKQTLSKEEYLATVLSNHGMSSSVYKDPSVTIFKKDSLKREEYLDKYGRFTYRFDDIISMNNMIDNTTSIDISNIETDEMIVFLDDHFKVSKYEYNFKDQTISRLKVLRIYNILKNNFDKKEALMYAITYNTWMDKEHFEYIGACIGFNMRRDEDELLTRS